MKFVFIHGPPAAGKLTIGRELSALSGWPLLHNHLAVDLALSVYPFGSAGFVEVRERAWWAVVRRALADRLPGLIFNFNPENSVPQRFIDELFAEVARAGAEPVVVALTLPEAEIERRLVLPARREFRKLSDVALYRRLKADGVFESPTMPAAGLTLDTSEVDPKAAAARILRAVQAR